MILRGLPSGWQVTFNLPICTPEGITKYFTHLICINELTGWSNSICHTVSLVGKKEPVGKTDDDSTRGPETVERISDSLSKIDIRIVQY